jgi:predicted alpha/beta hydrolase family esterase
MPDEAVGSVATPRRILFIQGGGEGTHDEWDDKLVASLRRELGDGYEIRYPRMPGEDDPRAATWGPAILREVAGLDAGSVVIGHSVGGTILIHTLADQPPAVELAAIALLAAPFVGDGGWPADEFALPEDLGARLPHGVAIHLFHGLADDEVPASHIELYARVIPQARSHRLPGRDHQLGNDLADVANVIRTPRP